MKEKNKRNKGITLIALVITVIVMFIIAGVALYALTGQDNFISKSKSSAEQYNNMAKNEANSVKDLGELTNKYGNGEGNNEEPAPTPTEESYFDFRIDATYGGTISLKEASKYYYTPINITPADFPIDTIVVPSTYNGQPVKAVDFGGMSAPNLKSIIIPEGIEVIMEGAFANNKSLQELKLPNSLKIIQEQAFEECDSLRSIEIKNVQEMGRKIFKGCDLLESVTFNNTVRTGGGIGATFMNCSSLKNVTLKGVKEITRWTFEECTSLESIDLTGIEKIERYAFYNCKALKTIFIPNSVQNIEEYAFNNAEQIRCEAPSKPSGWSSNWAYNINSSKILWGQSK